MVGRTKVTSEISIWPESSGKYRKCAVNSSATSPGSPLRSPLSTTLRKVTLPEGNRDTATSPLSAGSRPVTVWISRATASRTALAGIANGTVTNTMTTAAAAAAPAMRMRFNPVAAVTTSVPRIASADRILTVWQASCILARHLCRFRGLGFPTSGPNPCCRWVKSSASVPLASGVDWREMTARSGGSPAAAHISRSVMRVRAAAHGVLCWKSR